MSAQFFKKFKDDRKYFAIVLFVLFLIFISGILTPVLVEKIKDNWDDKLADKIINIESSVNSIFSAKESHLISIKDELANKIRSVLNESNATYGSLIKLINGPEYEGCSIEVLAPNGRMIGWNDIIAVKSEDILPLSYPAGETHFYRSDLVTYLTVTDTLLIENDQFYFVVSLPIEKNYSLQNDYYKDVNFTEELSNKFSTWFSIDYNPFSSLTRDGRKFSFELFNNKYNKIGTVTFLKPSLESAQNSLRTEVSQLQTLLIILCILFLGFGFRREFKALKFRSLKFVSFVLYCALFREALYLLNIPSGLLDSAITDPAYFSSTFGGGIVRSPAEFFVTAVFLLIIGVKAFLYVRDYFSSYTENSKVKYLRLLLILPLILLFFITFRSLNASIKSIIFDSTLRYFKEPDLIPSLPALVMNFDTLMFTLSVVFMLIAFIVLSVSFFRINKSKYWKYYFLLLFIVCEALGIAYIKVQHTPLITPVLSIVIIALLFIVVYIICFRDSKIPAYNYVFITLIASVISITLLNYFNLDLERESLKTTALEVNRSNDNLLQFFLNETLLNAEKNDGLKKSFSLLNSNYYSEAFILWSSSPLQKESLNSSIIILDKDFKELGHFSVGVDEKLNYLDSLKAKAYDTLQIVQIEPGEGQTLFLGLVPIKERGIIIGYLSAAINENLLNIWDNNIPVFLRSNKNIINSVIDPQQLKIYEFTDNKLTKVYGDIYPSLDQVKPIINANFSPDNEAWVNLTLNDEYYLTYIFKSQANGQSKITSVSVLEKNLSWNLFNFFKIFIIHSIFIIFFFVLIFISQYRNFKYSFRTQLLIAFLVISIIPVIILAVYNRQIVKEKTQDAILKELNVRSDFVENHIRTQIKNDNNKNLQEVFRNAGEELGISFSIYEGTTQIFNSKDQYYKAGIFVDKLDPEAYYQMDYLNYREFLDKENVDNYNYNILYKRMNINDRLYVISVNDAFNKIQLTYSVVDVDVFLFGIYSFATILIIILSSFLANRISLPIRRLTKATESIAHGDLNVEIKNKEKGEVKDLLDGFNFMTRELHKNQIELAELERENAWKEMAKQVAHEIKNPLTPMKLAVQQLVISYKEGSKNFDKMFKKLSSTLLSQIENLSLIATEFSSFARMPNYKMEEIDIIPVIHDTVNLFVDEKVEINVNTNLVSANVESDKVQLRRLIINFIRNSIQANASKIDLSVEQKEGNIYINISDNGSGIPERYQEKIFESNFTTKPKGMGLGLKLARRFIENSKGSIDLVESSEQGTTFLIVIPALSSKLGKSN